MAAARSGRLWGGCADPELVGLEGDPRSVCGSWRDRERPGRLVLVRSFSPGSRGDGRPVHTPGRTGACSVRAQEGLSRGSRSDATGFPQSVSGGGEWRNTGRKANVCRQTGRQPGPYRCSIRGGSGCPWRAEGGWDASLGLAPRATRVLTGWWVQPWSRKVTRSNVSVVFCIYILFYGEDPRRHRGLLGGRERGPLARWDPTL